MLNFWVSKIIIDSFFLFGKKKKMPTYNSEDAVYISDHITTIDVDRIGDTSTSSIINYSKIQGFPLYRLENKLTNNISYGIILQDWRTYFRILQESTRMANMRDSNEAYPFVELSDDTLSYLKQHKSEYIETYMAQRTIFPDDDRFFKETRKNIEYEFVFQLATRISDLLVFSHQKNILNFHTDVLLEIKNNMNREIPSIVLEVNEDGHQGYSNESEQFRQNVIEAFNNRYFKVDIPRKASLVEIEELVKNIEIKLRNLSKELIIDYSTEINEEDFIKKLEGLNIDKIFIKKFLSNNTGDTVFRYTHEEVGEFLGYSNKENFREFTKSFVNSPSFIDGVDYKSLLGARAPSKKTGNDAKGGHNKKTYLLTRSTFNRICINAYRKPRAHQCAHYFAQVYEAAMQYVQQLRARNITTGYDSRAKENDVKERMDQLVQQRLSRYNTTKMEKKMELIQESIYKLEEEKKILLESNNQLEISYKSVKINLDDSLFQLSKKEEEIEKLTNKKNEYKNMYRTTKTDLDNCKKEKGDSLQRLEKYQKMFDESPSVSKYERKIDKHNNIIKEKDEKILLLEKDVNKHKEKAKKYIKMVNEKIKGNNKLRMIVKTYKKKLDDSNVLVESHTKSDNKETVQDSKYTKESMLNKKMTELKDLCRSKGIGGYSKYKKEELIDFMLSHKKMI